MMKTILVALDGSAFSERALPISCELAHAMNATLVLVCVAGKDLALDQRLTEEDRQDIAGKYARVKEEEHLLSTGPRLIERAQEQVRAVAEVEAYLARIASQLTGENIPIELAVPYGPADEGILTEIELHAADLVVMSTHGRSGISRLVSGSTAQSVVARSSVPVLLVPPA